MKIQTLLATILPSVNNGWTFAAFVVVVVIYGGLELLRERGRGSRR